MGRPFAFWPGGSGGIFFMALSFSACSRLPDFLFTASPDGSAGVAQG
ncbi:hypothetical protein RBY4I_3575 [Rhodobacterales bacterium Y4I]|nr:hypothetical protein RBY4I_3575 [Rhodobacterales bacterium Y4I]